MGKTMVLWNMVGRREAVEREWEPLVCGATPMLALALRALVSVLEFALALVFAGLVLALAGLAIVVSDLEMRGCEMSFELRVANKAKKVVILYAEVDRSNERTFGLPCKQRRPSCEKERLAMASGRPVHASMQKTATFSLVEVGIFDNGGDLRTKSIYGGDLRANSLDAAKNTFVRFRARNSDLWVNSLWLVEDLLVVPCGGGPHQRPLRGQLPPAAIGRGHAW